MMKRILVISLTLLAGACGGGGADTVPTPVIEAPEISEYTGPAPATADVQSFRINVWDNLKSTSRCGSCHTETGGQSPMFVRQDDVNMAYSEATSLVTLTTPDTSLLVTKVGGGHNCWLSSNAACEQILETWVTAWAGDAIAGGGREIDLDAPVLKDPGDSKSFPIDSSLYASTIYPIATTYCAQCHSSESQFPQQPYFAEASLETAYAAARQKVDLDDPDNSRFVVRLGSEFHNCWSDCTANSAEMLAAVNAFADQIVPTQVDPQLVTSKALTLADGTVASGGNRYEANAIATYEFQTRSGLTAFDTSGIEPALNLNLSGDVGWLSTWGIQINNGKAQGSTANSRKLHDLIKATGEFTLEAWVVPGNVSQEEARIMSYSAGVDARNFTLGQTLYNYDLSVRSSSTDGNGMPALSTNDDDEDLQATLQHVVTTYDPVNGGRIYVNGEFTGDTDLSGGGSLIDWDDSFAFVVGNEVSSNRLWQGSVRFLSIHNRALSDTQIQQNFDAGVGEKFFLLFSVAHLIDVPDSYVMFQVSQFDEFSYLFESPQFISLDPTASPNNVPLQGMRIGINGGEIGKSQAYSNLDLMLNDADFDASSQSLSRLGTLVPLEKGPEDDSFFLTFELLGDQVNAFTEAAPLQPGTPPNLERDSAIGLRTFDEINASMSVITGVSQNNSAVTETYNVIKQQLPTLESMEGFLASHQVAIAQLSIEYCNELVNSPAQRSAFFPGFDFEASPGVAFADDTARDVLLDPLLNNTFGTELASQPDVALARAELNTLIDRLTVCGNNCDTNRTAVVAKATCAAMLGNAAVVIH
ncbi:MAG: LamG domain-containing protein [Gammaproteobacteria bacterium]